MSFILDALKKSESERQRQSGPALFEVKVAPPRSRFAVWGAAIAALLVINFVVVGVVLWRGSAPRAAGSSATPAAAAQNGAAPAAPLPAPPLAARYAGAAPQLPPAANTAPVGTSTDAGSAASRAPTSTSASRAQADAGANPDDLAPAVDAHRQASPPASGVIRATESGLPTYQDAAAEPGANIPDLRLDLHVYDAEPDHRFVFLNMLKLKEGDISPQGVRVEQITQDGVILSYRGKEFVLQRQ